MNCEDGASDYHEFRPTLPLTQHFLCLWTQRISSAGVFAQRVLPDGCVDILLMNDVPLVVGPWTEPFVAALAPGTDIIGARCHPGLAPGPLGVLASEVLNQTVLLRDLWGSTAAGPFARIAEETSPAKRMSALEAALLSRVNTSLVDKEMKAAIQWIARHPRGRIDNLSRRLGLSSRQIQRRFTMVVGYGPKMFQCVLRFQRLLNLAARTGVRWNLARLAAEADYADQAHMTRELQRFSGNPPSMLLRTARCALRLSSLIQTSAPVL